MAAQKADDPKTVDVVIADASSRMTTAVEFLTRDLSTLRSGRATPALLENLNVDYYGVPTPLSQLASIAAPEARLIVIQPWDKQALLEIEKSLLKSDMGFNPSNDGSLIRVPISPLSQERRKDMVRVLKKKIEDGKIAVRNVRRDALEQLRGMEKNKVISEDENHRSQEQLQKTTDSYVSQMDQASGAKEAEIMQV